MKFESRFIITVAVVNNLALLARLLIYLHTFTCALVHTHKPTPVHIQSYNRTFTQSHTHAHLYTQSHTHPHAYTNICLQYNHTHTHTHTQLTQMHAFKHARIQVCAYFFSVLKTLKLTLVLTNMHILLTHIIHITHIHKHTCKHTKFTYTHTHALIHTH